MLHYLDDFLLVEKAEARECEQALGLSLSHCATLGVLIARHKTKGPTASLLLNWMLQRGRCVHQRRNFDV